MEKDIAFGEKNATIFYRQNKVFFFDQSLSCPNCKLNDRVVVPNILFQVASFINFDLYYCNHVVEISRLQSDICL